MPNTRIVTARSQYPILLDGLKKLSESEQIAKLRNLCRTDLFFLLVWGLSRPDADNEWVFARSCEVEAAPDGYLDLWAREHYKSTIITFAKTIQDVIASHGDDRILSDEVTVGIFSHTRPIAKQFLRQIKMEFERNENLKRWFPDVLYQDPRSESPKWSEDEGIIVKRKSNPKESTVEAWGLVDGQPTSKHFGLAVYDDTVTRESVTSPEMIKKTTSAWELSRNLTAIGGRSRYIGTRYHYFDTYDEMMKRGIQARIHTATANGLPDGEPVFLPRDVLKQKQIEMQETFWAQMLMQPRSEESAYYRREWFKPYERLPDNLHKYGASDYAVTADGGDYTCHGVCGIDDQDDLYVIDVWFGKTVSDVWVEQFIDMAAKHKPLMWAEESGQIIKSLDPYITKRMRERRVYVKREQFTSASDKPTRQRAFQARAAMGKVLVPKAAPWLDTLMLQVLSFPLGKHDDGPDMLGLVGRMLDTMVGGRAPRGPDKPDSKWAQAFARRRNETPSDSWKVA
jgi:predicted phage terminase large subunit-like protein